MSQQEEEVPFGIVIYEREREDGYVSSGLDLDYISAAARDVAEALAEQQCAEIAYQPGDGTFYGIVFTPLSILARARPRAKNGEEWDALAVRGMTIGEVPRGGGIAAINRLRYHPNGYLVSLVEGRNYPVRLGDRDTLAANYVAEHWSLSPVSACSIAILLRAISAHIDARED